ncbi:MAG: ribonucleoside-diphosphate reductase subunit alpha [Elusimicrobia bacterium CG11_big_fil_rev_8_21_14_0_20_64_6]|nr:MAG: ribonucleoside-diphosphate reductase subunit alpha [Elusimicrobia bacterium CG11_big_fil_rev_8_21_14_0_20_64_6]
MQVRKRDGSLEPVDVNKIVRAVARSGHGLENIDVLKIATKTIGGLYDGATTKELDNLSIQTSALLIAENPEYSRLAARLLATYILKEVENQDIHSFSQSIGAGVRHGLISEKVGQFVQANARKLNDAMDFNRTELFEYFGLRTVYDRYLLKNPETREVIEAPQYFFMRVACGLADTVQEAVEFYNLISRFEHMPSSPTLFNSATKHPQMSSCYLLDSPVDDLEAIYNRYTDIAMLSKFSGGIGASYSRVRARGSLIRSTNGQSNGIIPWLKTLDSSVVAVNQGGKRKGACAVYLETWHADIEEFLELRDNTGDAARRAHNLHLAHWIPDLFMKRTEEDGVWSLFDPKTMPQLTDLYGKAFEDAYLEGESKKLFVRQVKARDLYARMMKALAETGNGWMNWKDASNLKANQTGSPANVVHSSNLCTEIIEVTSQGETAVCNLGSINLAKHIEDGRFDFVKLASNARTAVKYLDRVIDINFYPTAAAKASNAKWRPVGLGVMGVQDAFFKLGLPFDSAPARELSKKIAEEIYFHALSASVELAAVKGPHLAFPDTKAAKGVFQFEMWGVAPADMTRWEKLRAEMVKKGLRNSLLLAIAPTATIASIVGSYEATEPQISNLFKRETLSGEFLQVNKYLCSELKKLGLWNEEMRARILMAEGSIQDIAEIPENIRAIYRTVWEIPMRSLIDMAADRGAFIDQSQSLNLFMESPNIGKLSSMYMYAWKKGLKTSYYLRSRPATKIAKTTISASAAQTAPLPAPAVSDAAAVACSLENPESCEACQ